MLFELQAQGMDVGTLFEIFNVPLGAVCRENHSAALRLDLHHLHIRQQPKGPPDGFRRYVIFRRHQRPAINPAAFRKFTFGNALGNIQSNLQVLGGDNRFFHRISPSLNWNNDIIY